MTGCRCAAWWLVLAVAVPTIGRGGERLPTSADVSAAYRRNLATFPRPHVTMTTVRRASGEMLAWNERQLEQLRRAIADPNRSPRQREQAKLLVEQSSRALADARAETVRRQDTWTDRQSWQVRLPLRGVESADVRGPAFPREPLTPASLGSTYSRCRIYSFAAGEQPAAWHGIPNPGAPAYARISPLVAEELSGGFMLPPLCASATSAVEFAHPIDQAFPRVEANLKVLAFGQLEGRQVLHVEHRQAVPDEEPQATAQQVSGVDVVDAWLDPARGHLPLRVEWRRQLLYQGKPLGAKRPEAYQALRTTRIEPLAGGSYPAEGIIEQRVPRPNAPLPPTVEEMIAGKPYEPAMIVERTIAWKADAIEPDAARDANLFRLRFPSGTELFDENKLVAPRPVAALEAGSPAPELNVTRWTDGQRRSLAELRGRVVVLYFWMAWQDPCMAPLAVLDQLARQHAARGLVVLGVHVGNIELDELRRAAEDVGFPNALDAGTDQTAGSTLSRFRVQLYPTVIVIGRQGNVAWSNAAANSRELTKATARSLGITLPLPAEMDEDAKNDAWNRILATMVDEQVRIALERR